MCEITSITRQVKNKNRVSIFVDSYYFGSLDEKTFLESGLKTGDKINLEIWQKLQEQGENRIAFNKGISYISRMMRSEKQVRQYLKKKGFEAPAIEFAANKMKDYNYIDDENFAKMVLSHQINVKKMGLTAVKQALYKNGINNDITDEVLLKYDEEKQFENAEQLAEKLIKRYKNIEDKKEKIRKISQAMIRRGYSWDMINRALLKVKNNFTIIQ